MPRRAFLALALVAATASTSVQPKEHVRVQLRTLSGTPARVRVITRGLIVITPVIGTGKQPWQIVTTVTTPAEVALGGVGEADLRIMDTTTSLIAEVTHVRAIPIPPQRLSGQAFRVSRTRESEPFGVTNLP